MCVPNPSVKLADDPAEDEQVTDLVAARCPECASAVRPGAQWCTLCFADLRPREEPPVQPTAPTAPATPARHRAPPHGEEQPTVLDPLTAPLALLERAEAPIATPKHAAPTSDGDAEGKRGDAEVDGEHSDAFWPCLKCGEPVGIELSHCPVCGGGFMESGLPVELRGASGLDRLGSGAPDKQLKLRIMIGGAGALTIAIVAVLFIIGLLF